MDDSEKVLMTSRQSREKADRDSARIYDELVGLAGGTDPFAAAVRATRMPMIITDPRQPDNPVVFANASFCRLTGYRTEEIVGRNCRFLQGPETDPATVGRIRAAVQAARPLEIDIRNHRKDGEPFWNRLLMAPVRDAAGELAFFFASQVDVTLERERLQGLESDNAALAVEVADRLRAQEESEARLRFATEAGRLGIWELDLQTDALTASSVCRAHFGHTGSGDFTYGNLTAAIHPDDLARMTAAVEAAVADGGEYDIEYRVLRPGGTTGWVQARARVVRAQDGTPLRIAGVTLDITARRLADSRLELSEQSLRLATEAAEIGTWDLDLTSDVLTWSDRTKAMFGISPDVACSMQDFYVGLHPADREATSVAFASALDPARRATYDVEYRTIGKEDGVIRWVAAKGRGIFADGRCVRAIGTAIDITARKAAEARQGLLLALSDRLRVLSEPRAIATAAAEALGSHLDVSRIGYGQVQPDEETIVFDTSYAAGVGPLAGPFRLEAFGSSAMRLQRAGKTVVSNDAAAEPAPNPEMWSAIETGAFVAVPLVRDGRLRASLYVHRRHPQAWATEDVRLIEDVAARTWDALERARAETEMRESEVRLRELNATLEQRVAERTLQLQANEARLRTIFETSYQLQSLLTLDGTVIEANERSLAAMEATLDQILGKLFWDTPWFSATPGMPETVRTAVAAAAGGENIRREIAVQLPSGLRSFDLSLRPLRDAQGRVVAIVPEAVDITERREAEDALRQSQKMEAVGQLTGGLAHDFNNLLTGISGSLELLQTRLAQGRVQDIDKYVNAAQTSAKRAAALTHRLLAFSRRQTLDPKPTSINRLVADLEDLIARTVGPEIALEVVGAAGLWTTHVDQNQLENALLNLCINARDAMPDGGRLTIETGNRWLDDHAALERDLAPGQYVSLCVSDSGTGMTPDVIAHAFDPFFTTKPLGQGTGLGLSMIYGFTRQSGGQVRIYSEVGQGTMVCLYLPRHQGDADSSDTLPALSEAPRAEKSETVLVVDDEPSVRMLLTEVLADLGYRAIEAADAAAAFKVLHSDMPIDLLVTDVGLPGGINGRQLAEAALTIRADLKILFITGYAENAVFGHGHLGPGMHVQTKPFVIETLAKRIRDIIKEG